MERVLIVAEGLQDAATLAKLAGDAPFAALAVGNPELAGTLATAAGAVSWIETAGCETQDFPDAMAAAIASLEPDVVLGVARAATRTAFGKAAASMGAAIASNVVAFSISDGDCAIVRSVYDDFVEQSTARGTVFLLVNPLDVQSAPLEAKHAPVPVAQVEAQAAPFARTVARQEVPVSRAETAQRVVGVGLGASSEEGFRAAQGLAEALGAELGGSMNMVENTALMQGERYIGLSGMRIAPKLYVALGISGAAQHLVGIRNAETVVVVNSDPKARFFDHADYGIVGRVEDVAPAIARALE